VAWLPADFTHPTWVPVGDGYHLRPIKAADADLDYPAVMGSQARLWSIFGPAWGWPPASMTYEQDVEDLARHEAEIAGHQSFNYALLDDAETALLGCVYIDPPEKQGADAEVSWWLVDARAGTGLQRTVDALVPEWIAAAWPFTQPRYIGRDLSWADWLALPDIEGPAMRVFLETDRLVLRQFTSADADNLVSLDADPDVMRYVTGGTPTSREEIESEVLPAFLGYYQRYEGYGFWAVIEKETGEFLGWFHFRPYEDGAPGEVDLGYRLRKSAWGKGYATEGSRALIRKGFTEFGVQRVVAQAMAVNQASRRVMEKAGLTLVRTFHQPWPYRIEGDEFGDVEYALDRAGWQQLGGPGAG